MNTDKRKNKLNIYNEDYVKILHDRHLKGESIRQIAISQNIDRAGLYRIFKRRNLETIKGENWSRRYRKPFKENWFEVIDCPEKAYFLGFIYADGCIMKNKKDSYFLEISLQKKDGYILETFVNLINSDKKVRYIDKSNKATIVIYSKKLVLDLINKGVTYRKTYNSSTIPNIPENFIKDFILGFFDGDGSIGLYNHPSSKTKVGMISFVGLDVSLMSSIQNFLKSKNINIHLNIKKKKNYLDLVVLVTNRSKNIRNFIDLIYSECPVFLTRKKEIADQVNTVLNIQSKTWMSV